MRRGKYSRRTKPLPISNIETAIQALKFAVSFYGF